MDMDDSAKKIEAESNGILNAVFRKHPEWSIEHLRTLHHTMVSMRESYEASKTAERRRMESLSIAYPLIKQSVECSQTQWRLSLRPPVSESPSEWPDYVKCMQDHTEAIQACLRAEEDIKTFEATVTNEDVKQRLADRGGYAWWLDSRKGQMAKDASLYNTYNDRLETFKNERLSRIMELDKSNLKGTNAALRRKIAIGANKQCRTLQASYDRYVEAWNALPDSEHKPNKICKGIWNKPEEEVLGAFARVEDSVQFRGAEWTHKDAREGIRAILLLDNAEEERELVEWRPEGHNVGLIRFPMFGLTHSTPCQCWATVYAIFFGGLDPRARLFKLGQQSF